MTIQEPTAGEKNTVPVRSAILGAVLAMVVLVATVTFGASLNTLVSHPTLYGWNWSVKTGAPALPELSEALVPAFAHDPVVASFSAGTITQAELGLERVDVMGMQQEQGVVAPEMASPYIDDPEKRALLLRRKARVVPIPQLAAREA